MIGVGYGRHPNDSLESEAVCRPLRLTRRSPPFSPRSFNAAIPTKSRAAGRNEFHLSQRRAFKNDTDSATHGRAKEIGGSAAML